VGQTQGPHAIAQHVFVPLLTVHWIIRLTDLIRLARERF